MKLMRNHLYYRRAVIIKYAIKSYDFSKIPIIKLVDDNDRISFEMLVLLEECIEECINEKL